MYQGYGVHHMAIGVRKLEPIRAFYRDVLDFTVIFSDFPTGEYPALAGIVRGPRVVFDAVLFAQPAGGIVLELMQMIDPTPRPVRKDTKYGDIGLAKISITVPDVELFYREMKEKVSFCFEPRSVDIPSFGPYGFVYARDPEGNLMEFVSTPKMPVQGRFGGIAFLGVAVTDLNRSVDFYRKYGGFDKTVIEPHDAFSGLFNEITHGPDTQIRSCLLANSQAEGMLEIFEVSRPHGRSLPYMMRWGDYGYHQICLNGKVGDDVFKIGAYMEAEGFEFICPPVLMHDEREGAFFYMKDPDGIPVEFLVFLK